MGYFVSIAWTYSRITDPSPRQTLAFTCGLLWCVRICAFVGYRILVRGHDFRFDKLAQAKALTNQLFSHAERTLNMTIESDVGVNH